MFLEDTEIRDLTGYRRRADQIRWLRTQHIPFLIGGDGMPKVLRSAVVAMLGATSKANNGPRLNLT